jgi:hypothetical protein
MNDQLNKQQTPPTHEEYWEDMNKRIAEKASAVKKATPAQPEQPVADEAKHTAKK